MLLLKPPLPNLPGGPCCTLFESDDSLLLLLLEFSFAALEPNLRSLFAYAKIALLNSASPNSGHMASVKYSSVYAISNNMKFDRRCSPEVRMSKSGFCNDRAARRLDNVLPFSCCCCCCCCEDDEDDDAEEDEEV